MRTSKGTANEKKGGDSKTLSRDDTERSFPPPKTVNFGLGQGVSFLKFKIPAGVAPWMLQIEFG